MTEIKESNGRILSRITTPKKEGTFSVNEGRLMSIAMKPGEEKTFTLNIGKMYNLTSGEYTLTLKRKLFLPDKQIFVEAVSLPTKIRVNNSTKNEKAKINIGNDELLDGEIVLPEFNYTETTTVFQLALKGAKVSGGVVISTCGAAQEKRNFVFSQKIALREFLTGIERSDLNYKWEIEDEVGLLSVARHNLLLTNII